MRMNRRMMAKLGQSNPADFVRGEQLRGSLEKLLAQGFTKVDGAVVYAALGKVVKDVKTSHFPDLTGFECFVNHVHIEDQLSDPTADENTVLKQGIGFALATESQLGAQFPGLAFVVIVAARATDCGVRFHLARPGEQWLADNLDGYAEEAILVLEDQLSPSASP